MPNTIERFLEVDEVVKELLLVLQLFFNQRLKMNIYLFSRTSSLSARSSSKLCCGWLTEEEIMKDKLLDLRDKRISSDHITNF